MELRSSSKDGGVKVQRNRRKGPGSSPVRWGEDGMRVGLEDGRKRKGERRGDGVSLEGLTFRLEWCEDESSRVLKDDENSTPGE